MTTAVERRRAHAGVEHGQRAWDRRASERRVGEERARDGREAGREASRASVRALGGGRGFGEEGAEEGLALLLRQIGQLVRREVAREVVATLQPVQEVQALAPCRAERAELTRHRSVQERLAEGARDLHEETHTRGPRR